MADREYGETPIARIPPPTGREERGPTPIPAIPPTPAGPTPPPIVPPPPAPKK